jgi:signal peptidase
LAKISGPKGVIKDIIIVGVGVLAIWFGLQLASGTENPFYVVASGSMIPVLEVYDVLVVEGHTPFEDVEIGDIIVFDRPSDHSRVIVHRVVSILDDNPISLRTQGDANPKSIPGTDFPITQEEYIGKVEYTIPQIGYVTQLLKPPVNYIIIVVVIGVMVVKQIVNKKKKNETTLSDPLDSKNQDPVEELSDINKMEKDSEYSEHTEKSDTIEDKKIDSDESTKTDEKTSEKDKEE